MERGTIVNEPAGTIRKRRFAVIATLGLLVAGLLGGGIARGELPMNFSISGEPSVATVTGGHAQNVTMYARQVETTTRGSIPSVAIMIGSAELTDVCLSTVAHGLPFLGDVTMYVRVPGTNTTVQDLVIDSSSMGGSVSVANAQLGLDVTADGTTEGVVTSAKAAQDATMGNARIELIAMNATALSISQFTIDVDKGASGC